MVFPFLLIFYKHPEVDKHFYTCGLTQAVLQNIFERFRSENRAFGNLCFQSTLKSPAYGNAYNVHMRACFIKMNHRICNLEIRQFFLQLLQ